MTHDCNPVKVASLMFRVFKQFELRTGTSEIISEELNTNLKLLVLVLEIQQPSSHTCTLMAWKYNMIRGVNRKRNVWFVEALKGSLAVISMSSEASAQFLPRLPRWQHTSRAALSDKQKPEWICIELAVFRNERWGRTVNGPGMETRNDTDSRIDCT